MKHILVTGGAGFIGSNLIKSLLQMPDTKVTALDNLDDFYSPAHKIRNLAPFQSNKHFKFIEGDICKTRDLEKATDITAVVHLAAKAGVRPSITNPELYYEVNVNGTQRLLDYMRKAGVKQMVFASSSSVYGLNQHLPWQEGATTNPVSPYAASKLAGEGLGHVYSHLYGIRFLALRFFTVYGPGQRPDLAINLFLKKILNNEPIPVYGNGTTSRDYTFIGDVVNGIIAALAYEESLYETFNIGNHIPVTLNELISTLEAACGKKAIINKLPEQPGDVPFTMANIAKARQFLNYQPETKLAEGISHFYHWIRSCEDSFATALLSSEN